MAKNLVIVESPAKARTIGNLLGKDYLVKASLGHVRDLPTSEMGVALDDFTPKYVIPPGKKKIIGELRKAAKDTSAIYLATDPDREGEAISWHILEAAGMKGRPIHRVVFHQITPDAIKDAFLHPRDIDHRLVNAQQARRLLDRLVGYRLSPLLWNKLRWRGLSAGRVQSVALRLVVEREQEIQAFVAQEYWTIQAQLEKRQPSTRKEQPFIAILRAIKGQKGKLSIPHQDRAQELVGDLKDATYQVTEVKQRERRQRPAAPFITSTLQQEAWRKLRFDARRTMRIAQDLYEGLPLGDGAEGGLITYMRTDSTTVATEAAQEAQGYIRQRFGVEYAPKSPRVYTTKVKAAQEAHEAIRPTSTLREPQSLAPHLNRDQLRLYDLIWKRMVASQMSDALLDATTVDVEATPARGSTRYLFHVTGTVLRFPGFRAVYLEDRDDSQDEEGQASLPNLAQGEPLTCLGLEPKQHFTQPPPRYTEASLIKALEEQGIGRPSTYAPIVSTLVERKYTQRDEGRLKPTKLGEVVSGLLTEQFPDIMEVGFTARMEEELDEIARGEREWVPMLKAFYSPFSEAVDQAMANLPRIDIPADEQCPECGKPMVVKHGRYGPFLSCSGFPECRTSKPIRQTIGVSCPQCGGDLVERRGKKGFTFYGCSNYPTCNFAANQRPLPQPCPQCGKLLVARGRSGARCTTCDFTGPLPQEEPVEVGV